MIEVQYDSPRVSVAIPLYRSARFIDTIIANIEAMPKDGVEILISDRHCYDDTIEKLMERYATDHRVRFFKSNDGLDWVGNINFLLSVARGEYWRFLPHDDISPVGSLEALIAALDIHEDAILAYGPTMAIDLEDHRLSERDRWSPHPDEADTGWKLGIILEMFWKGYFDGGFKGLIRRTKIIENKLLIRSTLHQIFPERCWLFALCLLGSFCFVPEALYIKRYYPGSTHTYWKITGLNYYSAAWVMSIYVLDLLGPSLARTYSVLDLWLNARSRAQWQNNRNGGEMPSYRSAPDLFFWIINRTLLSKISWLQDFSESRKRKIESLRMMRLPQKSHR